MSNSSVRPPAAPTPVLGVPITAATYDSAVAAVLEASKSRCSFPVSALAVHGVMTGALDAVHRRRLAAFRLLVPDGQPVRWALKWLHGVSLPDRVYGPELMRRICAAAAGAGIPVFFYGSTPDVLHGMTQSLGRRYPALRIAGAEPSKFRPLAEDERDAVNERILRSGARIVFVGLGCPRQEIWAYEHAPVLQMPIVAVGAAFAFEAGLLAQAPMRLQRLGLEWAFRLYHEPRRLWRRYLLLNPLYLVFVALQRAHLARFRLPDRIPIAEQRIG